MDEDEKAYTATDLVVKEWRTVIETQMHFNEMILRTRTAGVSVVMGVYGAAVFALGQGTPENVLPLAGHNVTIAAPIVLFGLLLLSSILILDFGYYYQLLLGAVERGHQIDDAYKDRDIDGTHLFGLTRTISKQVGVQQATIALIVFYLLPGLSGFVFLLYLIFCYEPSTATAVSAVVP